MVSAGDYSSGTFTYSKQCVMHGTPSQYHKHLALQKESPFHALLHRDGKSLFILQNGGDILTGRSLSMVGVCRGKLILIGLSRGSWLPLLSERAAPTNPVETEAPRMCLSFHRRVAGVARDPSMPSSTRTRLGRPTGGREKLWREAAISGRRRR